MVYLLSHTIDRAAQRDADRTAFCCHPHSLTYGQLVDKANQLAHLLVDQGVRRGDRVGVYMPRSVESAVAVYGVLKAGGAFVPIDPRMPAGGLRQLVQDCSIKHLAVGPDQASVLEQLTELASPVQTVIGVDRSYSGPVRARSWSELDRFDASRPPAVATVEQDLAYIMYSSGSTGRPKGIMHTHRSGLSYAALSVDTYGVRPEDRIANHSPLHFDMSTFGYFSSPYAGATTVVIPEAYTKVTASLSKLIEQQRVTIWYSVPLALIQLLLRGVLDLRDHSRLRWVLFGGEPFPVKHLRALMRQWPGARFSNVYGPAEVNQCTYYHVPPLGDEPAGGGDERPIPIGRVWDNTEHLVLDEHDQPVDDGQVGELLIRSATMMPGYWNRPDLNGSAFYDQPSDGGPERRFYRTGDLVRTDREGNLLFLGRKDRQVKVRGYRVELDDIEHTLASHEKIEGAAVFPVRCPQEGDHVEAAVVPRAGASVEAQELRAFLSGLLSWYAVPARIELVETFPRTTTGKIDRRQLQAVAEEGRNRINDEIKSA